jgi:SAM-dependent methyltransferase
MERSRSPFEDAELYDILFADLRYDLDFYLDLAREIAEPVLEVACGTGRILIPCLQEGVAIEGLDLYPAMLDRLKQRAVELGFAPRLYQADMREFSLPHRYRLIFIAFNGFVHCLTTEDQLKTLRSCRRHLLPGGCFALTLFYPGREILTGPEGVPVLEREAKDIATGHTFRLFDTRSVDRVRQVQHSRMEIQELDAGGQIVASHLSETDMRWTFKPEMELLLTLAGFRRYEIFGGLDRRPLERDTDLMIVTAWND